MMRREIIYSFIFIFIILIFCLSANVSADQAEFYPTIFLHGGGSDPSDLVPLINKLKEHRQVYTIYAGDSDGLVTNSYSPDSIWNFGYYKNSASDPNTNGDNNFEASYEGRIGGIPIETSDSSFEARIEYSRQLKKTVNNILRATGASKVNLTGHSMGGMVARAYITWLGGDQKVNKFLSIAAPNHGISDIDNWLVTYWAGYPDWMDGGEFSELNREDRRYNGQSFTEVLDRNWVNIRSNLKYATIRGNYNPNIGSVGPDDGIVYLSSVYLEGAVFNATVFLAHTLLPGIPLIRGAVTEEEKALSHSTYTAEVVKRWIFRNQVNIGGEFPRYGTWDRSFIAAPVPFTSRFLLKYQLTDGDAVSVHVYLYDMVAEQRGFWIFPIYEGFHDLLIDTSRLSLADGAYLLRIKAFDMEREIFSERPRIIRIYNSSDATQPVRPGILDRPPSIAQGTSAGFSFSSDISGVLFSYRLDNGTWSDYSSSSSLSLTGLSYGLHSLYVSAKNGPFYCQEPAIYTWIVITEDSDGDGLLDSWERQYFGNLSQGPDGDPDDDCWTNRQEYRRLTNPNDANSPGYWCPCQLYE